ncbi:WYL domain-containing protein [Yoonia sp. BS5-3]|uniref:Helix-turn-helix transcriptional regulator n=1 Tax=Yoonia phaeophyticola TaxID=3137369 RepID=A0ABZ2V2L0_9RHOB
MVVLIFVYAPGYIDKYADNWHINAMANISFEERSERRNRLIGILRSEEHWKTADLRAQLGVSQRTLMRELAELRLAGYPIESDRGRGGGVRLSDRWGIERLHLTHQEVVELILALTIMETLQSPLLTGHLRAIRQKLFQAFPQKQRQAVSTLRKRILLGDRASGNVVSLYANPGAPLSEDIASAFLQQHCLEITYLSEARQTTKRLIEPHYILLNWPVWYIIAWDHLRDASRVFRIDRIRALRSTGERFQLKPVETFGDIFAPHFKAI